MEHTSVWWLDGLHRSEVMLVVWRGAVNITRIVVGESRLPVMPVCYNCILKP